MLETNDNNEQTVRDRAYFIWTIVLGFILIPISPAIAEDAKPPTNQDNRTKID